MCVCAYNISPVLFIKNKWYSNTNYPYRTTKIDEDDPMHGSNLGEDDPVFVNPIFMKMIHYS